jgi:hypothetical protein
MKISEEMKRLFVYQLDLQERGGVSPPTLGDVKDIMDELNRDELAIICKCSDPLLRRALDRELIDLEFDCPDEWVAVMLGQPSPEIEFESAA